MSASDTLANSSQSLKTFGISTDANEAMSFALLITPHHASNRSGALSALPSNFVDVDSVTLYAVFVIRPSPNLDSEDVAFNSPSALLTAFVTLTVEYPPAIRAARIGAQGL